MDTTSNAYDLLWSKRSNQQGQTSHTSRDREKQCPNTAGMKSKVYRRTWSKATRNKVNVTQK